MDKKIVSYILWFFLVCLWNFCFPNAEPIYDVIMAVILSFVTKIKFFNWCNNNYKCSNYRYEKTYHHFS